MASFPVHADAPGTGPASYYYYLGIAKSSLRKNEAFEMIAHLVSKGPQLENSRKGIASILTDPEMKDRFGEAMPALAGKRVQAFFFHTKTGSMDPEFDTEMQRWDVYDRDFGRLDEVLEFWRQKLAKIGVETKN